MNNIKVFLFASPNDSQNVYKTTRNCTFFNYYIDKNGLLRRKNVQPGNMSVLMYLSDYGIDKCPEIDIPKLSSDIVSECRNRRYSGIFLDFENRSSMELLRNTGQNAIRNGIIPFIPVSFAGCVQNAKLVIPSARQPASTAPSPHLIWPIGRTEWTTTWMLWKKRSQPPLK